MMECFVKMDNDFNQLSIIAKRYIIDAWQSLKYTPGCCSKRKYTTNIVIVIFQNSYFQKFSGRQQPLKIR